jgi:mannose-6-phosphate isomerase-like protein (cupin superfamily)
MEKKMDKMIKEALEQYKEKIDNTKKNKLDIGNYIVNKPWGFECWIELNSAYAYKIIHMKKGFKSSLQMHVKKYETNYVIKGKAKVLLENENGEMEERIYKAGEGWSVPLKTKHRVVALTDYTALEVSTPHLNDCIRFEDDSGRESGKIESEHKKWK